MNKNLIIGIVAAVVVVGGGYMIMSSSKDKDQNNSTASSQNSSEQKSSQDSSSAKQEVVAENTNAEKLAKSGKAQHCTFDYNGDQGVAKGNMYTDGNGKSRMTIDAITTDQGNSGTNDMIIRDNKYYTWITTGGQTIGFSGDLGSQSTTGSTTATAPDKDFSMKCQDWTVDNSKFVVPTNVNFTGLNLNNLPTGR